MNLVVDFGNTFIKAALFEDSHLKQSFYDISDADLKLVEKEHSPNKILVSSVSKNKEDIQDLFQTSKILYLENGLPLPFQIDYKTPQTLGLDRVAAVAGAQEFFPNENALVIDMGTCITYDFIDANSVYHGGGISPGMQMRFKALHNFTAKLPLIEPEEHVELIGQSTKESILSGIIYGISAEIDGIIRMYNDKCAHLRIIICGGDAKFFENRLKAGIFAAPELVLMGLNRILLYNA